MPSSCGKQSSTCISVWIPAPALTSRPRPSTSKSVSLKQNAKTKVKLDSQTQLKIVLKDIKILKEELLSNVSGKASSEEEKKLTKTKNANDKDVLIWQNIQGEKPKIGKALERIEDELLLKAEENERLSKQQDVLTDKLKSIKESAREAIKSIIPVSQFVRNLKLAKNETKELNEEIIFKLLNLVNMNQLSFSSLAVKDMETIEPEVSNINKNLQMVQLKKEIDSLKLQLDEDRRKISDLQKFAGERSVHEKYNEKSTIRIQKEKTNQYLVAMENLKSQITRKNTETDQLVAEVNSLQLQNSQLKSEKDRLEIEKNTLQCNVDEEKKHEKKIEIPVINELSSKLSLATTNIDRLEAEKSRLQVNLTKSEIEIQQLRRETDQLKTEMVNKNTHISVIKSGDNNDRLTSSKIGLDLWQELQKDKVTIMNSIKDLEKKLEVSQQTNLEFRNEISRKEEALQHIHIKLQEKIQENQTLRELLESALADVRNYTSQVDQKSLMDQSNLIKINELEMMLRECNHEKEKLNREISDMEKNYKTQINELHERLDLAERSKTTMHEYVKFLKTSYASVFGNL